MNVVVMRHGKVDFKWKSWYTSEQFDMDCEMYNRAHIKPSVVEIPGKEPEKILKKLKYTNGESVIASKSNS